MHPPSFPVVLMPPAQNAMASVSVAPQPQRSAPSLGSIPSDFERRPSDVSVLPPPNPPFVFPPRRGSSDESHTPLPLPPFSFNPGHIHTPKPSTSSVAGAPRPVNHRRQPSEFVGDAPPSPRLSASTEVGPPSNSAGLPPPGPGMSGRGPGRRGHAHRRSGALSSIDLSAVTKAGRSDVGVGSAPISPANRSPLLDDISRPVSRSTTALGQPSPPASPVIRSTHLHPGYRNTIAVDERTRPSSMISTDTGDSLSTIRPGHSRSNSASPNVLLNSSSSPSAAKPRPKTADASLLLPPPTIDLSSVGRPRSCLSHEISLEPGAPGEEGEASEKEDRKKSKKKKKKKKRGGASRRSSEKQQQQQEAGELSEDKWESASSAHSHSESEGELTAMTRKLHRKQKKVRSWAGSIFPLKTKKTRVKKPVAGPNSPARPVLKRMDSDLASLAVDFDQDNTVIIRTPTNPDAPKPAEPAVPSTPDAFESSWKPRSFYEQTMENEGMSPVIDLDAALGPFNTPEMGTPRVAGSAFLQASKRMYSGGRRGEFVGPEMRYHRRAESAPEMPPFDRSAFGFSRLGPDASMAHEDVFYEEEEDAFLANNQSPTSHSASNSNRVSSVDTDRPAMPSSSETVDTVVKDSETGDTKDDDESQADVNEPFQGSSQETVQKPANDSSSEASQKTQQQEHTEEPLVAEDGPGDTIEHEPAAVPETSPRAEPVRSVEIVEQDDWQARPPIVSNPDFSPLMVPVDKRPSSSPMDVSPLVPRLSLPRQPSSGSPFPSPDPSNMSVDGPRSATVSSMTDQTTFNHPFHEQSVEDVPSLTSSASTRTNLRGRISAFYNRTSEERSSAFSHTRPPGSSDSHSVKRSSLVSLSRLVGAAHKERSKLSFEAKPSRDDAEKAKKKSNRISRLMFWRSKDKHRPNDEAK